MKNRTLKVAHITTLYYGGRDGLEPKLMALDSYADIEITAISGSRNQGDEYPPSCIRQLYCPMVRPIKLLADLMSIVALYKIFRRERFHIVHTHAAKAGMIGAVSAWLAGVPLVFHTSHGLPFYEGQERWDYHRYRFLEKLACRFRDHYFTQNRRDMAECIRIMGSADKVSYEGNGVDINVVCSDARAELKKAEKQFPEGKVRLSLISRLEPIKRVGDFLSVCKLLLDRKVDISAVVAGCGHLQAALAQQLKKSGLSDKVRMLGWVPYVPSLIEASDIVVLTSEKEGIPRSIMEAMALVKPVVATDVPGTKELVENGKTGFLVPLGDVRAVAARISQLCQDDELRREFGEAGKVRVEEHFNDIKIAKFLRDFYHKAYEHFCDEEKA